ncbi:uncharacterized protein EDB91DRAFT_1252074 [Suillus paluster]|uniref:uncharacterized protein n=1 Tax=Suillus paluster TaxID=48578 RepID=UPI001B85EC60|nr:uncharacterized protein EDB91DRAFT_1252074 [Suillus paluster]KAG1731638.1 hypothetical protein EDB91DRAFT_1252074 [Suillus paluster]
MATILTPEYSLDPSDASDGAVPPHVNGSLTTRLDQQPSSRPTTDGLSEGQKKSYDELAAKKVAAGEWLR